MSTAEMRSLGLDLTPLELEQPNDPYMVKVPGFGVLIIGSVRSDQPIVRVGEQWKALLVQPDNNGRFGPESAKLPRDVTVNGDDLEVELLPNPSGERLVVVLHRLSEPVENKGAE